MRYDMPLKTLNLLQRPARITQIVNQLIKRTFVGNVKVDTRGLALPVTPDVGDFANSMFAAFQIESDRSNPAARTMNDTDPDVAVSRRHGN